MPDVERQTFGLGETGEDERGHNRRPHDPIHLSISFLDQA
jgi:hypothetical protein